MKRFILLCLLVALPLSAGEVRMDMGAGDVSIAYDPKEPDGRRSMIWLSYCIGRLSYVTEHRKEYPRKIRGELPPTFGEEREGRFVGLDTYVSGLGKHFDRDDYWEDVKRVSEAGYLDEYVWTTFHRSDWPEAQKPKRVDEFLKWRASELLNHKPETYGKLVGKKG